MFGDIGKMMKQLNEAQQKIEETKKRLDTVLIHEISANGNIKIVLTANRTIKSININKSLLQDKEELEDYLILTLNKALENANTINEQEMSAAAKNGLPDIPGMNF